MRTPEAPWPVAPRPFLDEAFGSWFGRLAARYRMTVDELAEIAGVNLSGIGTWLSMPPPSGDDLQRLARLCRVEPTVLVALPSESDSEIRRACFGYCHTCLFLNPVDVTAPYWKAGWLQGQALPCTRHRDGHDYITATAVRRERNLAKLLRFISRRHRTRQTMQWWDGPQLRLKASASGFRGHR